MHNFFSTLSVSSLSIHFFSTVLVQQSRLRVINFNLVFDRFQKPSPVKASRKLLKLIENHSNQNIEMAAAEDPALRSSFDMNGIIALEPKKNVPNHLTDTKIFAKLGQNEVLQANPASVHFHGFEIGKVHSKTLKIINVSPERQRMHIVPPTTPYFNVKYTKEGTLVPGLYLEIVILFKGSQYQCYNDCLRIHSKANDNIIVPLYAYPLADIETFPDALYFPPTALGQRRVKVIPLQCKIDVSFEFQISILQSSPAFSIEPMSGLIDNKERVELVISFTPQEYCTTHMVFQVLISEFNARPLICSVSGSSTPGLTKELVEKRMQEKSNEESCDVVDPRVLSPLNRSRNRKSEKKNATNNTQPKEVLQDGIRFPTNLNNPAAVSYVLAQKTGKMKAKDRREAVKDHVQNRGSTKEMKEAVFEHLVNRQVAEEERNQLRWCVKLGGDSMSNIERDKILRDRERAMTEYSIHRGDPQIHEEFDRSTTLTNLARIRREAGECAVSSPTFDINAGDIWHKRHANLDKFLQAARKILIRERVKGHLESLTQFMGNWRRGRFSTDHSRNWEELDNEEHIMNQMSTSISQAKLKFFYFPDYEDPDLKDDMAVDALGAVHTTPMNMEIRKYVHFQRLKVPSQYQVLGYNAHATPSSIYVPKGLARPIRSGPDDVSSDLAVQVEDGGMTRMEVARFSIESETRQSIQDDVFTNSFGLREFQLVAPAVLFKKRNYPPLHIFNPEPGILLHAPQLQQSEADEENKLLPVPHGTGNSSIVKLHKEDVIQGSMSWKRFPLQGLVSLNNNPTMSNVFVPRWSDPFSIDLMPESTPELLTHLPNEDTPIEEEEDPILDSSDMVPTMEMVRAQFVTMRDSSPNNEYVSESFAITGKLPSNNNPIGKNGPVSRVSKEKELEKLLRDRRNKLGQRIFINSEMLMHYVHPNSKEKSANT